MHSSDIIYANTDRCLETMALTEKQLEKVQVCENNWIIRFVGVTRAGKRKNEQTEIEVGVKERFKKKLIEIRRPES